MLLGTTGTWLELILHKLRTITKKPEGNFLRAFEKYIFGLMAGKRRLFPLTVHPFTISRSPQNLFARFRRVQVEELVQLRRDNDLGAAVHAPAVLGRIVQFRHVFATATGKHPAAIDAVFHL